MRYSSTQGTSKNFDSVVHLFLQFCDQFGFQPLGPSQECITFFITYLSTKLLSSASVSNYISIVRKFLRTHGSSDSVTFSFHSKQLLKASRVYMRRVPEKSPPLSLSKLSALLRICSQHYPKKLNWFKVSLLFAFFGFFRLSNLAPPSSALFDPSKHFCRHDVSIYSNRLKIFVKWSKSDQEMAHTWTSTLFSLKNTQLCPVQSFLDHLLMFPTVHQNQHYLVKNRFLQSSTPVTQYDLSSCFRDCCNLLGLPSNYTWHSVRRGAVHAAVASGASKEQIKIWGVWRSDAVLAYYPV
jgi:hypothetical protein